MKYDCLTKNEIMKFIEIGRQWAENGLDFNEQFEKMIWEDKIGFWELGNHVETFIYIGFSGRKIPTEKIYYRIGEPKIDYMSNRYYGSWNSAENCYECGVSVITENWLNSLKSVFFGAHDSETLRARGVYKITGYAISTGGDDELTIYPTNWAEKTRIRSISGIRKLIKSK